MPRRRRIILPGYKYHLTQRGNYQQWVFEDKEDYEYYGSLINKYSEKYGLEVLSYCLMGNHVHFIVQPVLGESISQTFQTVNMRYAQYFNDKKKTKGHLWQGRFYACTLGGSHLKKVFRYVEMNPVRAKIVRRCWNYSWSSAAKHVGVEAESLICLTDKFNIREIISEGVSWERYLMEDEDLEFLERMRLMTKKGLVIGSSKFVESLEDKLGISLRINKGGRPRKDSNTFH
ncbi:MAG: transposase [Candidatus Omnitrophica bacterium]|nr:transposase [Candidatus Omnitrophota bacterium]